MTETDEPEFDVFISYASEDRESVAVPLSELLVLRGLRVWIDQQQLTLGDSLRRKIDAGLMKSRYGVVVLSESFFSKDWPQKELDGLDALEFDGRKVILPLCHELEGQDIQRYSPLLAGRYSVSTVDLERAADEIVRAVKSGGGVAGEGSSGSTPGRKPVKASRERAVKKAKNTGDVNITGSPGAVVNVGVVAQTGGSVPNSSETAGGSAGISDQSEPYTAKSTSLDWKWVIGALLVPIAIGVLTILYPGGDKAVVVTGDRTTVECGVGGDVKGSGNTTINCQ